MRRVIDTSVLIDHLRGVPQAHALLRDAIVFRSLRPAYDAG
jgi:predicted nucleic acid-binding protein